MNVNIKCEHITDVVKIIEKFGNEVTEVSEGWSRINQVVYVKNKLSESEREQIELEQLNLRYWETKRTPHNAAEEGYICDICHVGITFPK
ncbi:hypothetical protein [Vibrio porteresiae]|uniref:Uncharacterized protein n=1 Tax=Vibrio porteresiae DSM 19223 TaxID=1123496 RepID=A0ABZ0QK67_9VIBR|nr:hypothetical protein [Vibrio porteresiae]WPC76870.1 hypothetical protein R8Z52_20300 [Vibrio porteresiae DSM 19223]